jgi:2-dehydropantoate 2-reductase
MKKKCLIIGAGAVGTVFGRHLVLGGADVTYFTKNEYLDNLKDGITLFHHNKKKDGIQTFTDFSGLSSIKEAELFEWNLVFIAISSVAIRSYSFRKLIRKISPNATLVLLQAGITDYYYISKLYSKYRVVQGMITCISYQAPLGGETLPECIAYWFPPFSPIPFSGSKERVNEIVTILRRGGMPAKSIKDVHLNTSFTTSFLMPFLAGLEINNWSFDALKNSEYLKMINRAISEGFRITTKTLKKGRPFKFRIFHLPVIKLVLSLQKYFFPFDLETYLRYHFLKVKKQTLLYLKTFIELGMQNNLPNDNLRKLYDGII